MPCVTNEFSIVQMCLVLYTLTCKHVIAIKKYVFKGAIILIPLLRPGVFSNISKRWRLP